MTSLHDLTVRVFPGPGFVSRFPGVCLVVVPTTPGQHAFVGELISVLDRDEPGPRHRSVRHIAGAIANAEPADVPALGAVCSVEADLVLLLRGAVDALVTGANGSERFSGAGAVTWTERVLETAVQRIDITADATVVDDAAEQLDLRLGVVPGGGFRLIASSVVAEQPSEAPREASKEPFAAIVLSDVGIEEIDERPPLPIAGESQPGISETADDGTEVIVTGFVCSRGHFNSPEAAFCGVCGIAMVQLTRRPVEDIRPPLGYLVVDDGSTFLVNRDYVVGREPERDPRVQGGRAAPIKLTDRDQKISRVHARILLDGWDVKVVDQHSANGTFVEQPGEASWTRIEHDLPVAIQPGTRLLFGRRTIVFDSHFRPQ